MANLANDAIGIIQNDSRLGTVRGNVEGTNYVNKFGRNPDLGTGVREDIWDGGGIYVWPTVVAETTVVSDDAADTEGSTGGHQITIMGLDANYLPIQEVVILAGETPVVCANQYLRIFRAFLNDAGSSQTNEGNIQIKQGANVLAQISIGYGQTLMALYTLNATTTGYLDGYYATINRASVSSAADCLLFIRLFGSNSWQCKHIISIISTGNSTYQHIFGAPLVLPPKTDIRLSAEVSANNTAISSGFELLLIEE